MEIFGYIFLTILCLTLVGTLAYTFRITWEMIKEDLK